MLKRLSLLFLFVLVCQTAAASDEPAAPDLREIVSELVAENIPYADGVILVKLADGESIDYITADYETETNSMGLTSQNIYLINVPSELPSACISGPGGGVDSDSVVGDEIVEDHSSQGVEGDDLVAVAMEYLFAICLYLDNRVVIAHPNYVEDAFEGNPRGSYSWDGVDEGGQGDQYALTLHNYQNVPRAEGANTIVAILDTGVDGTHPYLDGYVLPGYDVIEDDGKPVDEQSAVDADGDGMLNEAWGHGTHVAGIIHAVAPQAEILPVRVLNADGHGTVYDVALGIQYALSQDVDVINLSLSGNYPSPILEDVLQTVAEQGVLLVASAGNANENAVRYPAAYDNVIAVAAIDENNQKTDSSSYGDWITVSAAGSHVRSSVPEGDGFAYWSGTSMAAPFVSGFAALVYSADATVSADIVIDAIISTSKNIDPMNPEYVGELGAGRLDIGEAVRFIQSRSAVGD